MVLLDMDQVITLAAAIENPPRPRSHPLRTYRQYGLLSRVAALTGLRAGETGALTLSKIDFNNLRVQVSSSAEESPRPTHLRITKSP